jgi:type I restriction enzyme S subunit
VRLGEVLRPAGEVVRVRENQEYPNFGIYSFGRGLFRKPPISGLATSASSLVKVKAGQFIYSRLFAFEGAYGLVGPEFDGAYVSNEYPVFDIDESRVVPRFLLAYVTLPSTWSTMARGSKGVGVRRQRVQPAQVLGSEMPLPPLAEQQRLVPLIAHAAEELRRATALSAEVQRERAALSASASRQVIRRRCARFPSVALGEAVTVRGGGTPPKADPSYWEGDVPWVTPKDMKRRTVTDSIDHISSRATEETPAKLIEPGAVLVVTRGMILAHTVPSAVLATPAAINQDMKALIPDSRLDSRFLCAHLWAHNGELLRLVEKSTHDTRKLETAKLLGHPVPLPPLGEQLDTLAELDALQVEVDTLKAIHAAIGAELDPLLPAILNRAFAGML